MPSSESLQDQVLAALERALAEQRPEVVELLLRALETLCADSQTNSKFPAKR